MRRRAFVAGLAAGTAGILAGPASGQVINLSRPVVKPYLRLRHATTGEVMSSRFETNGRLDAVQARRLDWFMRDWREREAARTDPDLFRFLAALRHLAVQDGASGEFLFYSGFRTKRTNDMLRRTGFGVARFVRKPE